MMHNFDLTIVGGGMVGLALARALEESDFRIAIIEGITPSETLSPVADSRVSALSRASEVMLRKLGVWQEIEKYRCSDYTGMEIWEQDSFAKIEFQAEQMLQQNLGHIVENQVIQRSLLEVVKKQSNVTLFMPNRCQTMAVGESEVWMTLDDGNVLTTKLVVGADGANSWVRKQQNTPLTHWDYGHSALVANIKVTQPHDKVARQIFTPHGPLAFLPLDEHNLCSIVWSTDPLRAENLVSMPDAEFNKVLAAEFDCRLGLCEVVTERRLFPLKMRYARDFVTERVALVGDAAHTIHPLAGQGVNLGLLDAASLAEELLKLWSAGKDIGRKRNLRYYERWRKAEAAQMIAVMQGFKDLFDGSHPAKKLFRGLGMSLVDKLPPMKQDIIDRALGLKGELPQLARESYD
ncbi:FAD-dependent 2-octaprenylphenol hydroxylase [Vibrio hippocampi]|uniref:2-octaprenylphenol hydroxylase n=1 Tax=Vibrio hippocampi TaxID=654686 RepID=A0ABM8ZEF0_9VIBR|nr:FAD-dependent 2-octaprenylphenol hydroxylase [Vibrio hippocampi]CAH0524642.1 2-octaprenylphenol hydroxylase [Vibrio hippocampi]